MKISTELVAKNLIVFANVLKDLRIKFWLDGGTLLGAYRDKDFCKDDQDDVDLSTLDDYNVWDLANIFKEKGFKIYRVWPDFTPPSFYTKQISIIADGGKIDLMLKKIKNDKAWWTVYNQRNLIYKSVPKYFYENLKTIKFYDKEFSIPEKVEEYLTYRYGNWKTPVHRSRYNCFSSDRCIIPNYEKI